MKQVLEKDFFERKTILVARKLIGKFLVRRLNGRDMVLMITETESYDGMEDKACHAWRGQTPRNTPMFGPPCHAYVYFAYGMHFMLNLVTREEGYPAAVLIRSVGDIEGPARLTKSMNIDKRLNAKSLTKESGLWVEDRGIVIPERDIKRTPRIGVAYAGEWAEKKYRFVLKQGGRRR